MKKLIATITLILCLGVSSAFANNMVYNGYAECEGKFYAVIDNELYEIGDMIQDNSNCKVEDITKSRVYLICNDKQVIVYFKKSK